MPTGKLLLNQRVSPSFVYPATGRARIFIEAEHPVDVFVSTPEVAKQIASMQAAAAFVPNILIYGRQTQMDQLVTLPPAWKETGWSLTIAHTGSAQEPTAVHYQVYPA
jgi:hypothetical protein